MDQSVVAQPVVREPAAEETTGVEFVPAAAIARTTARARPAARRRN